MRQLSASLAVWVAALTAVAAAAVQLTSASPIALCGLFCESQADCNVTGNACSFCEPTRRQCIANDTCPDAALCRDDNDCNLWSNLPYSTCKCVAGGGPNGTSEDVKNSTFGTCGRHRHFCGTRCGHDADCRGGEGRNETVECDKCTDGVCVHAAPLPTNACGTVCKTSAQCSGGCPTCFQEWPVNQCGGPDRKGISVEEAARLEDLKAVEEPPATSTGHD
jgi:hypothetical protein